jgi:hypothetical protein
MMTNRRVIDVFQVNKAHMAQSRRTLLLDALCTMDIYDGGHPIHYTGWVRTMGRLVLDVKLVTLHSALNDTLNSFRSCSFLLRDC